MQFNVVSNNSQEHFTKLNQIQTMPCIFKYDKSQLNNLLNARFVTKSK